MLSVYRIFYYNENLNWPHAARGLDIADLDECAVTHYSRWQCTVSLAID